MVAPAHPFHVTWMPNCLQQARTLGTLVPAHLSRRLGEVVQQADTELKKSARTWGDPHSDLKGMRMTVYARRYVRDGLIVWYAVHMEKDEVFVQLIEAIRGGPFDV